MIDQAQIDFKHTDYDDTTVIGEFSGRDSVAAIMKAFQKPDINYILPIATLAGTEYGDFNSLYDNFVKTKELVIKTYGDEKILYPLIEYNRSDVWHLLNGRVMTQLINKYQFYTPCIGCHLYFHLTKLPFASKLSKRIISGERASHDGKIKVNQLNSSLETYKRVLNKLGYELIMPLQNMTSGEDIQDLIGWTWDEGKDHPKCVLSGNYRAADGKALYNESLLAEFFKGYLEPVGHLIGHYLLENISEELMKLKMRDIL